LGAVSLSPLSCGPPPKTDLRALLSVSSPCCLTNLSFPFLRFHPFFHGADFGRGYEMVTWPPPPFITPFFLVLAEASCCQKYAYGHRSLDFLFLGQKGREKERPNTPQTALLLLNKPPTSPIFSAALSFFYGRFHPNNAPQRT